MTKRALLAAVAVIVALVGSAVAVVAQDEVQLRADGPVTVRGTDAAAPFSLGGRTIRQVRYVDDAVVEVGLTLANLGGTPVTVTGLDDAMTDPRLFDLIEIIDDDGERQFTLASGARRQVVLRLRMTGCETLSARAGSVVDHIGLTVDRAWGLPGETVTVRLPEEVRAGSPREAGCADASAGSRPAG